MMLRRRSLSLAVPARGLLVALAVGLASCSNGSVTLAPHPPSIMSATPTASPSPTASSPIPTPTPTQRPTSTPTPAPTPTPTLSPITGTALAFSSLNQSLTDALTNASGQVPTVTGCASIITVSAISATSLSATSEAVGSCTLTLTDPNGSTGTIAVTVTTLTVPVN